MRNIADPVNAMADGPKPPCAEVVDDPDDLWRVLIGDYGIVCSVQDEVLTVLNAKIRPRREAYRRR